MLQSDPTNVMPREAWPMTIRSIALLMLCAIALPVEAAEPRLDQIEPQGVRRGDEVQVKLSGPRVGQNPAELLLYEAGIEVTAIESIGNNNATATLKLAKDCPLGRHALRLRTATGLSNLVTLHVGTLPSVAEAEPNNSIEAAQHITLDHTVHGVIQREDQDVFTIEVTQGERVSIEVEGLRLGRTLFDPVIEVLDAAGEVIASNDDQTAARADAFLSLPAPADGKLWVRLRESAFRGDGKSTYLLHLGHFPRPAAMWPLAVAAGSETSLASVGSLTGEVEQTIRPETEPSTVQPVFASDESGTAPTELSVWVADAAPALEAEPNNKRDQATPMPCPGVGTGVVSSAGDIDHYRIEARKGQTLDIRVRARELRSPLDSVLRVFDAKGKRLAGNDDDRGKPDSYVRFKPPADGEYVLEVEDRLNRGGPAMGYVLDVAEPKAVAEIKLDERRRYNATVIEVPQGGRTTAIFTVTRRDFGGELGTFFDGLPTGVTAECFPLAGNFNRVPVVFSASEDAEPAARLANVSVQWTDKEKAYPVESRFRQQTWLVRGRNNVEVWSHYADRVPVAVTKRLPFSIQLEAPKAPLCRGGSMNLKLTAQRDEGFDQAIRIYTLYHSPGLSSNRSRSITKGKSEATIPVTANGKARTGEWPMVVVGETNLNGRVYTSTQFVPLVIAEPYFDMSVPTLTAYQGKPAEWTVKLSPRTPFEGAAKLELVGLPHGVTAEPVEVEAGAGSAAFAIRIEGGAKLGRHRGIGCRATLQVDGEPVVFRQAYAELRIDPPREQTAGRGTKPGRPAT